MNARRISDLLIEFGPRPQAKTSERVVPFERRGEPKGAPLQENLAARLEEAYQRGRNDAQAAAVANCEARLKDYAVAAAKKRAELRDGWTEEQGTALAELIRNGYRDIEGRIAGSVARVLEPFVSEAVRQRAVDEFIEHLKTIANDPSQPLLRITGPADLLARVRQRLGSEPIAIEYVTDASCDVRVVTSHAIIETRAQAWVERLKEAVR